MSDNYQLIASTADIPAGKTHCVTIGDKEILLCHSKQDGFFAVDNLCTHADARLDEGKLKGCKIICPFHGAAFDIRDGSALSRPASIPLKTYPLQQDGDDLLIKID